MTTNKVDFTKRQDEGGWAKYLPAISGFYATHLGKAAADESFVPAERVPEKFELGIDGLDFLKSNAYFSYKYALYSAGHAERNLDKCDDREPMIHKREKDTILIGDSGGFQIATGVIKLDWANVKGEAGDKLRNEILRYLEHTADWSMTLDVPAFAAVGALSAKTGLTTFEETLDISVHNLDYFMKHRIPGATKFLNVLSGSSEENSATWFNAVIPYSIPETVEAMGYSRDRTFEGYAFAGINMRDMRCVLNRLLDLIELDALKDKDWIHFLGIGRLDWACYLTTIERSLREHYNPNINISFDAASPFVAAGGYALCYDYNHFTPQKLTYSMGRGLDNKALKGSKMAMPFQGPIMERLKVGDICVMGPDDLNKHGKKGKTSWDTTSYALIMAHNVYNHIQAVQEVNRLADLDDVKGFTYRDLPTLELKSNKIVGEHLPVTITMVRDLIRTVLDPNTKNAREIVSDYDRFLFDISFKENKHSNLAEMMNRHDIHHNVDEDTAIKENE